MGADMTLACAPACDLTPQRSKRIKQVVRAIPDDDEDFRDLMESLGYDDSARAKRQVVHCALESQQEDRQITTLHITGCPYPVHVSGGLSWGDPPTEAYTVLEHVARCPQLWQVLEEFAREDALAAELACGDAAGAGSKARDVTVVLTSAEFGNEHFHCDSLHEALATIGRLVLASAQEADGVERLIAIVVKPGVLHGDPKRAAEKESL